MTTSKVIAISAADDAHLEYVQRHLSNKMTVIDPYELTARKGLSFAFDGEHSEVLQHTTPIRNVSGVWHRKPSLSIDIDVPEAYRLYCDSAFEKHCALIRGQFPEACWVSDYYAIRRAENKSLGLQLARRAGLNVPDTLFTSNATLARRFLDKHATVVVKTLARVFPELPEGPTFFFARKIHKGEPVDLTGLHKAPAVFQQAIDVDFELRINVVDNQVFTSAIHCAASQSAVRDWRADDIYDNVRFSAFNDLSSEVKRACIAITRELGLKFGAIDMGVDKKGQLWFFEINANGQWAFLDDATVDKTGKALARLLTGNA